MLAKLFVQNYALIKELDIDLDNGLIIITGETGAGKTILLGALSLILGNRADTSILLDKNEKCIVEGTFKIQEYDLKDFFVDNNLDYDDVALIRREINPAGKTRAFINDTPVNLNLLKELGSRLIDIHSQHQTLMLNENAFQLSIIDSFAGISEILGEYRIVYYRYRKLQKEYNDLKDRAERNRADFEYYTFQLDQLKAAELKEGEQEELEKEQEILDHAEEIKSALTNALSLLSGNEISILSMLRDVRSGIDKISSFISGKENIPERIFSTYIEINDLTGEIEKLALETEADPERLTQINSRLDLLYSLIQKHRVKNLDELIIRKEEIANNIRGIGSEDLRLEELETILMKESESLSRLANDISSKRKSILPEIELKIIEMLRQLGMPNAKFRIVLTVSDDYTPSGIDKADFLFSANKQTKPEELSKIASGGELSRVMLSLKSLMTKNNNLPTIIFDEIDSGVSGEVADKVGQILSDMGAYMQVINITHLPQIASRGNKHYHVYKEDTGDSSVTRIKLLSPQDRIIEVARLLSGSEITEIAIKNAEELIQSTVKN